MHAVSVNINIFKLYQSVCLTHLQGIYINNMQSNHIFTQHGKKTTTVETRKHWLLSCFDVANLSKLKLMVGVLLLTFVCVLQTVDNFEMRVSGGFF